VKDATAKTVVAENLPQVPLEKKLSNPVVKAFATCTEYLTEKGNISASEID
jgi:hypothetical protein